MANQCNVTQRMPSESGICAVPFIIRLHFSWYGQ